MGHYRIDRDTERDLTTRCSQCGWTKPLHGFYVWDGVEVHEFVVAPRQSFMSRLLVRFGLA